MKTIADAKDVLTTTASAQELKYSNFMILQPFLVLPLIEIETRDPKQLLIEANSLIAEFDTIHANKTGRQKAGEHCRNLISFLWCVTHDLVSPMECISDSDDRALQHWSVKRHVDCILASMPQKIPSPMLAPHGHP